MTTAHETGELDLRGLKCPLPALRTRKALRRLSAGEEIIVQATDPMSVIDIPHVVAQDGHVLLAQSHDGAVFTFHIRRGSP